MKGNYQICMNNLLTGFEQFKRNLSICFSLAKDKKFNQDVAT